MVELRAVPRRAPMAGRWWLLAAAVVLAPMVVLVVAPTMLGLNRFVVSGDQLDGSVGRGSVVFASPVPASAVEPGDVISFRVPGGGAYVTRRVGEVEYGGVHTTDALGRVDPWVLPMTASVDRMVAHVPWIGYPFLGGLTRSLWALLISLPACALVLALVADLRRRRRLRQSPNVIALATDEPAPSAAI